MPVHTNSKRAFGELSRSGKLSTQQEQMLQLFGVHDALTMREAHLLVNINSTMELVSVRARCTELLQAGLLEEASTVKCQFTERTVSKLRLSSEGRNAERKLMDAAPMPVGARPAVQPCALLSA